MLRSFVAERRTFTTKPLYSALLPASYVSRLPAYLPTAIFVSDRIRRFCVFPELEHGALEVFAAARLLTVPAARRTLVVPPFPSGIIQPLFVAPVNGI